MCLCVRSGCVCRVEASVRERTWVCVMKSDKGLRGELGSGRGPGRLGVGGLWRRARLRAKDAARKFRGA